jgi:hypothetical protein
MPATSYSEHVVMPAAATAEEIEKSEEIEFDLMG